MSDNQKFLQAQPFTLYGSGAVVGDTTLTLKTFTQIDGTTLITMSNFGTIGFGTIEPGSGTQEEQICFTGVTQNANGTATLTGVKNVSFAYPYTQTSGLSKNHAGATSFVISNTSGFYDELTAKNDDETVTGTWTFTTPNFPTMDAATPLPTLQPQLATKAYVDSVALAGAPSATTSVQGMVQLPTQAQVDAGTTTGSTGASLTPTPDLLRSKQLSDYVADTGTANAYAIAPSPVITAYATGQRFTFKVKTSNTGASTLAINGLSGTQIIRNDGAASALGAGDLIAGQIVEVESNGNGFVVMTPVAGGVPTGTIQMYAGSAAPTGWLLCDATSYLRTDYAALFAVISTTYGSADGTHFNVPDMRGRVPVGVGTGTGGGASGTGLPSGGSALTAVSRGTWKGEETHTLAQAELPNVNFATPISVQNNSNPGGSGVNYMISGGTTNTPSGGSGTAFNQIQPVMGLNFVIKT